MSISGYARVAVCACMAITGVAVAAPVAGYSTTVRLHDGRQVECRVNEGGGTATEARQTLTRPERNEAEIIATARLRLKPGNRNAYPDPTTAPHVQCD